MIDDDLMNRMVEAAMVSPWENEVPNEDVRAIIRAAIRAGNLVPSTEQQRDEALVRAQMEQTIADLRDRFGDAARVVFDVGQALMAAGFAYESDGRDDQPPRHGEMAGCVQILHESVTRAERERDEARSTVAAVAVAAKPYLTAPGYVVSAVETMAADVVSLEQRVREMEAFIHAGNLVPAGEEGRLLALLHKCERERDEAVATLDRIHDALVKHRIAADGWEGMVRAVEQTAAQLTDRTSYAAELEERVAGLERGAKVRDMEERIDAQAGALRTIHNILIRNGSLALPDLVGVVQGVATELERRDERVRELEGQLSALTEAAESRDKVSRLVADLRDHSLHGQLEALQAEELRLLRLVSRLVDGQQ